MVFGVVPKLQRYVLNSRKWSPNQQSLLEHAAGPFTIFFWCPFIKWLIVGANISDMAIPVENVSLSQQSAIATTGFIWARYCTVIVPVNYSLCLVNLFMGFTGLFQIVRRVKYNLNGNAASPEEKPAE
jgi:hypothetical protein